MSLDSDFSQRLQNSMKPQIDQENARQLGLTLNQYYTYAADVHNGMDTQKAYERQILPAAEKAGYLNPQNYIDDVASSTKMGCRVKRCRRRYASVNGRLCAVV